MPAPSPLLATYEGKGTLTDRHGTVRKVLYRLRVYRPVGKGLADARPELAGDLEFASNGNGLDRTAELTLRIAEGDRLGIQIAHAADASGRVLFRVTRSGSVLERSLRADERAESSPA
jgi:hypothetical protein